MRFRAEQHLRRQRDFRDAREKGRRLDCGAFTIWSYRRSAAVAVSTERPPGGAPEAVRPYPNARVGVIASTAAVGGAVLRNRAKRRLREVFRHYQALVPPEYDLLLIARSSLNRLEYLEIEQKFVEACRRLYPPSS